MAVDGFFFLFSFLNSHFISVSSIKLSLTYEGKLKVFLVHYKCFDNTKTILWLHTQ